VGASTQAARASLAGIALALRALSHLLGRAVGAAEIVFAAGQKPRFARRARGGSGPHAAPECTAADFSISHSGHWVGCAAIAAGRIGLDIEMGSGERIRSWVAREAALKAAGEGIRALRGVELQAGGAICAGELWHARALDLFADAAACVMTSCEVGEIETRVLVLEELFADER